MIELHGALQERLEAIEKQLEKLDAIEKRLADLTDLLRGLPEIQAAVLLRMTEELEEARLSGRKTSDLWVIAPPEKR